MSAPDSPSRIHDDLAKIVFGEKYELPPVCQRRVAGIG